MDTSTTHSYIILYSIDHMDTVVAHIYTADKIDTVIWILHIHTAYKIDTVIWILHIHTADKIDTVIYFCGTHTFFFPKKAFSSFLP